MSGQDKRARGGQSKLPVLSNLGGTPVSHLRDQDWELTTEEPLIGVLISLPKSATLTVHRGAEQNPRNHERQRGLGGTCGLDGRHEDDSGGPLTATVSHILLREHLS